MNHRNLEFLAEKEEEFKRAKYVIILLKLTSLRVCPLSSPKNKASDPA